MIRIHRIAVALTLLIFCAHAVPCADAQVIPSNVETAIEERIASGDHPGFVVGLIDTDGSIVRGFGRLSGARPSEPDGDTVYEIGSITKVFTAILLMDAVRRGEVSLDDPVTGLLPDSVDFRSDVTLAHLAEHTSGLPRMPGNFYPSDPADPFADYSAERLHAYLSSVRISREPGASYEYSNTGTGLLGYVLARQAGTDYESLLMDRVLSPLGLDDTSVSGHEESRTAPGHSGGRPVPNWTFDALAGAGALRSTAADMLRFVRLNLDSPESELGSILERIREPLNFAATVGGDSLFAGLGWHFRDSDAGRIVWHNGGTGGYRSFIGFLPDDERGVVVLTNSDGIVDDLGFHVLDPTIPLAESRPTVDVDPAVLETYTGSYMIAPGATITVTRLDNRLYAQLTGQQTFRIYPASDTRFFYKVVDAEIEFQRGEDDSLQGLTLYQSGREIKATKNQND